MTTRREFIGASTALLAASTLTGARTPSPMRESLNLLFLGGTGFIGPHQINEALARGHKVTMFNRGRKSGLYGGKVEQLVGDRDANVGDGLESLKGDRRWDVVVDNSGYVPRHVRDTAELLKDRVGRYLFTSTVAVYDYEKSPSVTNAGPLLAAPSPATEKVTGATYGPLKAECDRIVREIYGERATVVRPCYIVGPGDNSDRFTYWVDRFHRGGNIVCPAGPAVEAQWIDVRDLCQWIVRLAEQGTPGVFNGAGPASAITNEQLMWALRANAAGDVRLHWASAELLNELSYRTPMFDRSRATHHTSAEAARKAGLTHRSLAESVRDIQEWWLDQSPERRAKTRGWPSPEQEAAVIARL